jgi:hypothetical protein
MADPDTERERGGSMTKQCEDCGRRNFDSAVTCVECGSLFPDMVGRLVDDDLEPQDDPPTLGIGGEPAPEASLAHAAGTSHATAAAAAPGIVMVRCGDCKLVMESGPLRCKRCGSRKLDEIDGDSPTGAVRGWASRRNLRFGRESSVDGEFPTIGLAEVLALGGVAILKLLLEIPLGVAILLSALGPGGVGPTTYAWRYPLGALLLGSATAGAVGAYGLFYLERFGPILLCVSFAFDALLVAWLVVQMMVGELAFWPGAGPYFVLFLLCVILSYLVGRLAAGNRLGRA